MQETELTARRATVEDLAALRELWKSAQLAEDPLAVRLTDFQIAIGSRSGQIAGCIALRPVGGQGMVFGEIVKDGFDLEAVRGLLLARILVVGSNHGLSRLWLRSSSEASPQTADRRPTPRRCSGQASAGKNLTCLHHDLAFKDSADAAPGASCWLQAGFVEAAKEDLEKAAGPLKAEMAGGQWMVKVLKSDSAAAVSLEKEFDLFVASQKEASASLMKQAKVFKVLSWVMLLGFGAMVIGLILYGLDKRSLKLVPPEPASRAPAY